MEYITFLSGHPHYAGLILIILMMMESAPVIGFFLPGTFILPLLGAVTASSNSSFWTLFACAVAGAFLGDMLGFWLGRFGAHKWQPHIFSTRRQRTAKRARELINKHGLLALFLGRFVWLIHPAIPGAAGLLGVKTYRFILVDLPAILLWVLLYMGGGHLLTGFWFSRTFEFIEILGMALTILLLLLILRYLSQYFYQRYRKKHTIKYSNKK